MIRSYQEALDFLYKQLPMYQRVGAHAFKKSVDNIIALCNHLGNPQDKLKCIHIAGTNGKGSTAHFIASILQESGYKVAMYTSPHYVNFRERIKINGVFIPEDEVLNFLNDHQDIIKEVKPSFFELCVGIAFDYFSRQNVDYTIIETGLGGRLDSTNIIRPLISIITNIDYDHQDMLGDTLPLIAEEKAGIIKENIPVLIGQIHEETNPVFKSKAEEKNAPIYYAKNLVKLIQIDSDSLGLHFELQSEYIPNTEIEMKIAGNYQYNNVANAIAAIIVLTQCGKLVNVSIENVKCGLEYVRENTHFVGRWQILNDAPLVICDSAHNVQGISQAFHEISDIDYEELHIVTGFVGDKNWKESLSILPYNAHYYIAKPNVPRGLDIEILYEEFKTLNFKVEKFPSVASAYLHAIESATPFDLVLVIGSTFVAADVLEFINGN